MSLKSFKSFLVISLLIAIADITFVYMNNVSSESAFKTHLKNESHNLQVHFDTLLAQTYSSMLSLATYVASDEEVQQLFLRGKEALNSSQGNFNDQRVADVRAQLLAHVSPSWAAVQKNFSARQLHFHLGPGSTSFLRVHKPNKFGDNMDDVRFTIVDTNRERAPRTGFETGRVYSGLRGVVPISAVDSNSSERVHVGALEVGTSFEVLLNIIDQKSNFGAGVLLTKAHIESAMWPDAIATRFAGTEPDCECVVEASSREGFEDIINQARDRGIRFRDGGDTLLEFGDHAYQLSYLPLRDYLGKRDSSREHVGAVVFWRDVTTLLASHKRSQYYNILYGLLTYLFVELLVFWALRLGVARLKRVIEEDSNELHALKNRLNDAQEIAHLGNWEWNLLTQELWWSDEIYRIFELKKGLDTPSYERFLHTVHPADRAAVEQAVADALEHDKPYNVEHRLRLVSGEIRYVEDRGRVLRDAHGNPISMAGTVHDVSLKRAQQEKLKRAASVFSHAKEGIIITDCRGMVVETNKAVEAITGYSPAQLLTGGLDLLKTDRHGEAFYANMWLELQRDKSWQGELWHSHKNGRLYLSSLTVTAIEDQDGEIGSYVGIFSDITQKKQEEQRLIEQASKDPLTQLLNRRAIEARIAERLLQVQSGPFALLFMDLDGFKAVNDTYGHNCGDELLVALSKRFSFLLRVEDSLARVGGDEFIILCEGVCELSELQRLADRLIACSAEPVQTSAGSVNISASIGAVGVPVDIGLDYSRVIQEADKLMYEAKRSGKNRVMIKSVSAWLAELN